MLPHVKYALPYVPHPWRTWDAAWRSHDVTAQRCCLAVGGGFALAALPFISVLLAVRLGDS